MTQSYPTQHFLRLLLYTHTPYCCSLISFSHHFSPYQSLLSTGITAAGRVLLCGLNGAILGMHISLHVHIRSLHLHSLSTSIPIYSS